MEKTFEQISRPSRVSSFQDGRIYEYPDASFTATHLFSLTAKVDDVILKLPSDFGWGEFVRFVRDGQTSPRGVRTNERLERLSSYRELLAAHPGYSSIHDSCGERVTHFILVHKLQYERLRQQSIVEIPESRFVVLRAMRKRLFFRSYDWIPTVAQQCVTGNSLWDMFDHDSQQLRSDCARYLPALAPRLSGLLASPLAHHINWNIDNFIYDTRGDRLHYVDSKPTTVIDAVIDERNRRYLREEFITPAQK
jgi:hypothetical protein